MTFHRRRTLGAIRRSFVSGTVFQGAGDALAADHYWGTRAYTLAGIGANAIRLIAVNNAEQDFVTVAGGGLDMTGINNFIVANGACTVMDLYDQVGTNHIHFTVRPSFVPTGLGGSKPVLRFSASGATTGASAIGMSISAPWSVMAFAKRTAGFTVSGNIIGNTNVNCTLGYDGTADTALLYATGAVIITAPATDNTTMHSLIGVSVSGAGNSKLIVDGSPTSGDTGAAGWAGSAVLGAVAATSQACPDMDLTEAAIYSTAITSSGSSLSSNQHTYYG